MFVNQVNGISTN